jgi:hypothetical protein
MKRSSAWNDSFTASDEAPPPLRRDTNCADAIFGCQYASEQSCAPKGLRHVAGGRAKRRPREWAVPGVVKPRQGRRQFARLEAAVAPCLAKRAPLQERGGRGIQTCSPKALYIHSVYARIISFRKATKRETEFLFENL